MNAFAAYTIPYFAQVASPELPTLFFEENLDSRRAPCCSNGIRFGRGIRVWVDRACGIACVKMVVEGLGGPQRQMMNGSGWVRAKWYLVTKTPTATR